MKEEFKPKIIGFTCNWCTYAGADLAGTSRTKYPPNIRIIRVMCSGRIDPMFVIKALLDGADGVFIGGCHPGDCHYLSGNFSARRKFAIFSQLLEHIGIEKGRVQFSWVSAAEANRFAEVISEVTEDVRKLGPAKRMVKKRVE